MFTRKLLAVAIAATGLMGAMVSHADDSKRSVGEYTDDKVTLSKVKTALIGDKTADANEINVEVNKGIVQLNGFVDSEKEKAQAETVAKGVEGVKGVQNNLSVKTSASTAGSVMDDSSVTAKVKSALIDSSGTKAGDIKVETKAGVVQLSGFVESESQKSAATKVASGVKGVKSVQNNLSVKGK
jgi:hyperosmotically inducible protein